MEGLAILVFLALAAIPVILPIVSLVVANRTRARLRALEDATARLQDELHALTRRVQRVGTTPVVTPAAASPDTGTSRAPAPALFQPRPPAAPPPAAPPQAAPPQAAPPPVAPAPVAPLPVAPPPAVAPRAPVTPPLALPAPPAPRTPRPPRPPQPPEPPRPAFDWESLVGVRLFSAVAGVALVVAAIFFLRYSIEQGWLQPPVRVAIGVLTGLSLLVVCERKAARRYAVTANALDAAAVSILFATFFAAHALWRLIPALPTFLLLALVAAVAVLLSIRHESLFIAVLGLLGGFSTPALLSTGENRPVPLFGYLLLLNLGLAWVARERGWPLLTGLSLVLTTLYQWAWVFKFLDAPQVPLAIGIFLVLPAASLGVLVFARRRAPGRGDDRTLHDTAFLGAALPLLFTVYLAAVPGYGARFGLLFGALFLLDASLLAIGLARRQFLLHLAAGLGTLVTFAVWLARSYTSEAWPTVLGVLAVFVCLYLVAESLARSLGRDEDDLLSAATLAAPLLLATIPALVLLEPAAERPLVLFGAAFALFALVAAVAVRRRRGSLYFVAAFFVLIAEAAWSARYLAPERLRSRPRPLRRLRARVPGHPGPRPAFRSASRAAVGRRAGADRGARPPPAARRPPRRPGRPLRSRPPPRHPERRPLRRGRLGSPLRAERGRRLSLLDRPRQLVDRDERRGRAPARPRGRDRPRAPHDRRPRLGRGARGRGRRAAGSAWAAPSVSWPTCSSWRWRRTRSWESRPGLSSRRSSC